MTKHTPGPWRKHSENRAGGYEIVKDIPDKGSHLLVASTCETALRKGESNHAYWDASLIAAAPELYEALKNLLAHHRIAALEGLGSDTLNPRIEAARAALAKAERRTA